MYQTNEERVATGQEHTSKIMAAIDCSNPEIKTILSSGVNVVEIGHPIEVYLSNIARDEKEDHEADGDVVHAHVRGNRSRVETNIEVQDRGNDGYIVHFDPPEPDNYTLEVLLHDCHIEGSPFRIKVVEKDALLSDHLYTSDSEVYSCVTVGDTVNLIIPTDGPREDVNVSVESTLGECNLSLNTEIDGFISVKFTPTTAGEFLVYAAVEHVDISGSPFKVTATDSNAVKCFIPEEDMHIFNKTLRLGRGAAKFCIFTKDAGEGSLHVVSWGPGKAEVKLLKNKEGSETCEVTPSVAGKYYLDILWNEEHIHGSPFQLQFRRRRTRIISDGLHLDAEKYRVGVPYRFKLNCQDAGDGELKITCTPASAANVTLSPTSKPNSYLCEVVPQVEGQHQILVRYGSKHILGSPFSVHFNPAGDASQCFMVGSSGEHEIGGKVSFQISTEGAGEGTLTAHIENVATRESMPVATSETTLNHYKVEFNPGQEMECLLTVMYDNKHIQGSPFQLMFSEPSKCIAEGEGLISAQAGTWNKFRVNAERAGPGDLSVSISGASGEKIQPTVAKVAASQFEVSYLPTTPGNYTILVQWGKNDILGSPFSVRCYSTTFALQNKPRTDVFVGDPLELTVQALDGTPEEGELTVSAVHSQGENVPGRMRKADDQKYICILDLREPGRYTVSIRWNGVLIQGTPFRLKLVSPPRPENVTAYGPGLEDGCVGQAGKFAVDTADGGTGLLAVRVHGPKEAFKIKTSRHPEHDRTLMVQYDPTNAGQYRIDILWSGEHIPGSPFVVNMIDVPGLGKEEEKERERVGNGKDEETEEDDKGERKVGETEENDGEKGEEEGERKEGGREEGEEDDKGERKVGETEENDGEKREEEGERIEGDREEGDEDDKGEMKVGETEENQGEEGERKEGEREEEEGEEGQMENGEEKEAKATKEATSENQQ